MNVKKVFAGAVAAAAICALSVCGTLAYLTATTEVVKNTFTVGSIFDDDGGIDLKEHEPTKQDDGTYILGVDFVKAADYDAVLPADVLPKDPAIYVEDLIADAYVFVEVVDETTDLTFGIDTAWTELSGVTGSHGGAVYYGAKLSGTEEGTDWTQAILADDQVTVGEDPADDMGALSFYGYICQAKGFDDAASAWAATFGA